MSSNPPKTSTTHKTLNIAILGSSGRMGSVIWDYLNTHRALHNSDNAHILINVHAWRFSDGDEALMHCILSSDVVVDMSRSESLDHHLSYSAQHKKPFVVGVTGLSEAHHQSIQHHAQSIPIMVAPNTSFGMFLVQKMLHEILSNLNTSWFGKEWFVDSNISSEPKTLHPQEQNGSPWAPTANGWSIALSETHHAHKQDAPSGTAKQLQKQLTKGGYHNAPCAVYREGDALGTHTITLKGPNEEINITHQAYHRNAFSYGILCACVWIAPQSPGLYSLEDVWCPKAKNGI